MADSYRRVAVRTMPAVVVTMPAEIDVRNAPSLGKGLAAALSPAIRKAGPGTTILADGFSCRTRACLSAAFPAPAARPGDDDGLLFHAPTAPGMRNAGYGAGHRHEPRSPGVTASPSA